MPIGGTEHIVHPTAVQPSRESTTRHLSITLGDGPRIAPEDSGVEAAVRPPAHTPTLSGLPTELQLAIMEWLPIPELVTLDTVSRQFHELAAPQLAVAKAVHFATRVTNSTEVQAVIRFLIEGLERENPDVPSPYPGLEAHLRGDPLIALGHTICEMEDRSEREKSMAHWTGAVFRLPVDRWVPDDEQGRIFQPSGPYRSLVRQENKAILQNIAIQLHTERYPEVEIQAALDALGIWLRSFDRAPIPAATPPLVQLATIIILTLTLGVSIAATSALSEARRPRGLLQQPPGKSTQDLLAESVQDTLVKTAQTVQAVKLKSADPDFAPHVPHILAALPSKERLARLDVTSATTQRAIALLVSHIRPGSHLHRTLFGQPALSFDQLDGPGWEQLGRVAFVMMQLLLASGG